MRHSAIALVSLFGSLSSAWSLPLYRDSLPNGLIVLTYEDSRLQTVRLDLVCRAGSAVDPEGKGGTANLTAYLLTRGTKTMSGDSVTSVVEFLGASFSGSADQDHSMVGIRALSDHLDVALDLVADAVLNPAFDPKELELARTQNLSAVSSRLDMPAYLVGYEFNRLLFGRHPYANQPTGDTITLRLVTRNDIVQYHATFFRPNNCFLVVVGDVRRADLLERVQARFGGWRAGSVPVAAVPELTFPPRPQVKLITRPDMNQTYVVFGHPGTRISDPDMLATRLMAYVLGGSAMSSRLGSAVREQAGLAYDVRCYFDRQRLQGAFRASVQTTRPREAIGKMFQEISLMHEHGPNRQEAEKARNYYTGSFPLTYSSSQGKAYQAATAELYGLGTDWLEKFPSRVEALTVEDLAQAARDHLRPGSYVMVVMGNVTRADLGLDDVDWIE